MDSTAQGTATAKNAAAEATTATTHCSAAMRPHPHRATRLEISMIARIGPQNTAMRNLTSLLPDRHTHTIGGAFSGPAKPQGEGCPHPYQVDHGELTAPANELPASDALPLGAASDCPRPRLLVSAAGCQVPGLPLTAVQRNYQGNP